MTQSDERMAELRELFFESAEELLQALNEEALKLEKRPGDAEIVRSLRRIVHTLKGDAAACGYRELSEVAHELEDALALESAAAHATVAEVAFSAADLFAALLTAYRKRSRLPSREALRKMVKTLTAAPGGKAGSRKKAAARAKPWVGPNTKSWPCRRRRRRASSCITCRRRSIPTAPCRSPDGNWCRTRWPRSARCWRRVPRRGPRERASRSSSCWRRPGARKKSRPSARSRPSFPMGRPSCFPERSRRRRPGGPGRRRRKLPAKPAQCRPRAANRRPRPPKSPRRPLPTAARPFPRPSRRTFCAWMPSASTA